jgi:hypothetical protein
MLTCNLVTILATQNIALSWTGFTLIGGLLGLLGGIALLYPLAYVILAISDITFHLLLPKFLSHLSPNEDSIPHIVVACSIPLLIPILGIGIGVSISQSILISQFGIAQITAWIFYTSFAHFIATFVYSISVAALMLISMIRSWDSQDSIPAGLEKNIQKGQVILVFAFWGILIGFSQWILMKQYFINSIPWFLLSAIGISVSIFISWFFVRGGASVLGASIIGMLTLFPYGLITGRLLEFLLRNSL